MTSLADVFGVDCEGQELFVSEDDIEYRTGEAEGCEVLATILSDDAVGLYPESASEHVCPLGQFSDSEIDDVEDANSLLASKDSGRRAQTPRLLSNILSLAPLSQENDWANECPAPELEASYNWRQMTLGGLPEAFTKLVTEPASKQLELGIHSRPVIHKETLAEHVVQGCRIGQYAPNDSVSSSDCEGPSTIHEEGANEKHLFDKNRFPCGSIDIHRSDENKNMSYSSVDSIDYQAGTWIGDSGTHLSESTSQGSSGYSPFSSDMRELGQDISLQDSMNGADVFSKFPLDGKINESTAFMPIRLFGRSADTTFEEDDVNPSKTGPQHEIHKYPQHRENTDLGNGQVTDINNDTSQNSMDAILEYNQAFSIQNELRSPVDMRINKESLAPAALPGVYQQTMNCPETPCPTIDGTVEIQLEHPKSKAITNHGEAVSQGTLHCSPSTDEQSPKTPAAPESCGAQECTRSNQPHLCKDAAGSSQEFLKRSKWRALYTAGRIGAWAIETSTVLGIVLGILWMLSTNPSMWKGINFGQSMAPHHVVRSKPMMDADKMTWSSDGVSCFSERDFFVAAGGQCQAESKEQIYIEKQQTVIAEDSINDMAAEGANDRAGLTSVLWRHLWVWRLLDYIKFFELFGGLAVASGSAIFLLVGRV